MAAVISKIAGLPEFAVADTVDSEVELLAHDVGNPGLDHSGIGRVAAIEAAGQILAARG